MLDYSHCIQVGASLETRKALVTAVFSLDGVAGADNTLVDEAKQKVRDLCTSATLPESVLAYIDARIFPLLDNNRSAGKPVWTNNNAESINSVLKHRTNWHRQRLPDLIETMRSLVDDQQQEEVRTLYRIGDYTLAAGYKHYAIPRENWKEMSADKRERTIKQFLANTRAAGRSTHVTSTDGRLHVRQPTGSKKPHQTQRPQANRTSTRR